jgi:hypothetical protein
MHLQVNIMTEGIHYHIPLPYTVTVETSQLIDIINVATFIII